MSIVSIALLIAAPGASAQGPVTAEEAIENYRAMVDPVPTSRCEGGEDEEIVVCGRRPGQDPRLALPVAREPGRPFRGEPASAAAMMPKCTMACPPAFGFDVIKAAKRAAYGVDRLIHGE